MTTEQKMWLDAHPGHTPIGERGGFVRYEERGVLTAGGFFVKSLQVAQCGVGAFEVGARTLHQPGEKPQRM